MVYGKIFYNNIKEYTPTWMKTIPYSQVTKTVLGTEDFLSLLISQEEDLKSSENSTLTQRSRLDGYGLEITSKRTPLSGKFSSSSVSHK